MIDFSTNYCLNDLNLINFVNLTEQQKTYIHSMRNHEDVRSWMLHDEPIDLADHLRFCKRLETDRNCIYYLVRRKNADLGVIYITGIDLSNRNGFLGIYANPFLREIGHKGTFCMQALDFLAFPIVGLHTLKLEVLENNYRAIGLYIKSGFAEEGRLKEFVPRNGSWVDMLFMGKRNAAE